MYPPEKQISLTDPDARSMITRGGGIVGCNAQTAVDVKHYIIAAHEVTKVGCDRGQLYNMATQAKEAMGTDEITIVADRGYYNGKKIKAMDDSKMDMETMPEMEKDDKAWYQFWK